MKYNIGFVLGGGGTRGFAHLGIIEALREKGITPDIISGVSAGAISGAFISSGKSPHETHEILKRGNLFKYSNLQLPSTGLLRLDGLQKVLEKEIPYERIEDLPIPLFVGVSNITDGRSEFHHKGPLSRTILASASIPILFSPVEIDGKLYSDGGLLENLPVEPLVGLCQNIIVSNVSPLQKPFEVKNLIQMVMRTFHVSIHSRIHEARKHATVYIEPSQLTHFDLLNIGHADEAFEIGYRFVTNMDGNLLSRLTFESEKRAV
jgi:NTE family protein